VIRRRGYALIELPLVLAVVALVGIVAGAILWHQNGRVTLGAIGSLALALPLCLFVAAVAFASWRDRK
jgi:hypothetical protein